MSPTSSPRYRQSETRTMFWAAAMTSLAVAVVFGAALASGQEGGPDINNANSVSGVFSCSIELRTLVS